MVPPAGEADRKGKAPAIVPISEDPVPQLYQCPICDKKFNSGPAFSDHQNDHRAIAAALFKAPPPPPTGPRRKKYRYRNYGCGPIARPAGKEPIRQASSEEEEEEDKEEEEVNSYDIIRDKGTDIQEPTGENGETSPIEALTMDLLREWAPMTCFGDHHGSSSFKRTLTHHVPIAAPVPAPAHAHSRTSSSSSNEKLDLDLRL